MPRASASPRTVTEPESSDSLRAFGAVLKAFRERASLTQEQFAPLVSYSQHFVSSVEQGRRLPPADFVERAERALDAFGALRAAALHVGRRPGLASWFRVWAELEESAVSLCTYECRIVPGLLQTEAYARAVMLNVPPPPTAEEIEQRIEARLDRQRLLTRTPPIAFSFIIEEWLLRKLATADGATEAIDHLIECAELWNVEIQVMPASKAFHAGADGPMRLLETEAHQWIGYSEGQQAGVLINDPKDISLLEMRYAKMRSQAASPEDSVELLKRMRGTL